MKTSKLKLITLFIITPLIPLCFSLTSCSSTKVLSSWSIQNPHSDAMNKILILSVMVDRSAKEQMERVMVDRLKINGINAYSAMDIFGPKSFEKLTYEEVADKLKSSGFTSIMVISLLDKEKEKSYSPGTIHATPLIVGYSLYYSRYLVTYEQTYTPGYYITNTNYILQADIYTISDDEQLIYSAQTKSYDPNNAKALAESFSKSITIGLKEKGIIPNTSK